MAASPLRASDRDRERVTEHLRRHCGEGRLTVEELEARLDRAMAATTVAELSECIEDLPPLRGPGPQPPEPVGAPPRAGPVGVRPFVHRVVVPATPEHTRREVLNKIAPQLARFGYRLVSQSPTALVFEDSSRPAWAIPVAIFAFPLGLLALGVKRSETLTISLEPHPAGGTVMIVHGDAPRRVRKAFLGLTSGDLQA